MSIKSFKDSRCFRIKLWGGLYEQFKNHFLFPKLTSNERVLILHLNFFRFLVLLLQSSNLLVENDRFVINYVVQIFISAVGYQQFFLKYFFEFFCLFAAYLNVWYISYTKGTVKFRKSANNYGHKNALKHFVSFTWYFFIIGWL